MTDITGMGVRRGRARLHHVAHIDALVADLPVRSFVAGGQRIIAAMALPRGRVVEDQLARAGGQRLRNRKRSTP
ncbi:hypothetical protein [Roseovarius sp. SYSU LYC5162]|uniref:hypothetical protein n=1 Tax=Roseovarius TaxID=74030 RepID=UPI0028724761|nr:hypothetical protein [Roseovarius sp.]